MSKFCGFMMKNGKENPIIIYAELDTSLPYISDYLEGNIRSDFCVLSDTICKIHDKIYNYNFCKSNDEIIMYGIAKPSRLELIFPCMYNSRFFVVTTKKRISILNENSVQ
uniref:Uncharacterized protein n=1 Tax=viral metagenome TaxID=1070528 RepID=A0A6C0LS03_9ZZZZ